MRRWRRVQFVTVLAPSAPPDTSTVDIVSVAGNSAEYKIEFTVLMSSLCAFVVIIR